MPGTGHRAAVPGTCARRRLGVAGLLIAFVVPGALASCAPTPIGNDVGRDIAAFAYQNVPRFADPRGAPVSFHAGTAGAAIASSDIPWQVPAHCRAAYRDWLARSPTAPAADQLAGLRAACPGTAPKKSFVGVAITGGGNKSAVYATEVLFELQRYHLLDSTDVVSSVSGGSFAALLFALSCDPGVSCQERNDWHRPVWTYETIRHQMETDYFWPFVGHRVRPDSLFENIFAFHGADDDMAAIVSGRLLHQGGSTLTFGDLNPARPNLILNATNITKGRTDFDLNADIPALDKRPLSDDDALHFAFTQQYFWRLMSDLDRYPLAEALVASAAFPLIIDPVSLRDYRSDDFPIDPGHARPTTSPKYISLYDGGVHDNFGVTELTWYLACALDQLAGATPVGAGFYQRQCGRPRARHVHPASALVFGLNSSLLRSEGQNNDRPKPRSLDTHLLPIRISGAEQSVDMVMAASGEQRKQQLWRLMRDANPDRPPPGYAPHDPENPLLRSGPYQYVDIDIEATQTLYCESTPPTPDQHVSRNGAYDGTPSTTLLNAESGASDASRCRALQGVLTWNRDTAHGGRNLMLPQVPASFCGGARECPPLEHLVGDRKFMTTGAPGPEGTVPDAARMFFDPENRATPRLLENRMLFDAVKDVPTDFELDTHYAWLLRYVARWSVAHRIWDLCHDDRPLLDTLGPGKAKLVCDAPLDDRVMPDDPGSEAWRKSGL